MNTVGLVRATTFSNAATFTIPTLVPHGFNDRVSLPSNSNNIFDYLTSVTNKALVQVKRASHAMLWDGCFGARCDDGDPNTTPYSGNF